MEWNHIKKNNQTANQPPIPPKPPKQTKNNPTNQQRRNRINLWEDRNIFLYLGTTVQGLLVNGIAIKALRQSDEFIGLIARSLHPSCVWCSLHLAFKICVCLYGAPDRKKFNQLFFFLLPLITWLITQGLLRIFIHQKVLWINMTLLDL